MKTKLALAVLGLAATSACAALVGLDKEYTSCGSTPCPDGAVSVPDAAVPDTSPPPADGTPPPPDAGPDATGVDAADGCPGLADATTSGATDDGMAAFVIPGTLPTGIDRYDGGADAATVYDYVTGLTWERYPPDTPGDGELDYTEARQRCAALRLDGRSDWRIPTKIELLSIMDHRYEDPSLDQVIFPQRVENGTIVPGTGLWTSTPAAGNPAYGWYVHTSQAYFNVAPRDVRGNHVRCVR